jgi:nicotinamide phosphoribosyltransferase
MLQANPTGIIACVSDSYDLMRAVRDYWGDALRDEVLARDGVLVVRPDSGDPVEIVPDVIEALMARFGYSTTAQGFRLLNDKVQVIQGDGVQDFDPKVQAAIGREQSLKQTTDVVTFFAQPRHCRDQP